MTRLPLTPSQTAGPYFTMRIPDPGQNVLCSAASVGSRIRITGRVLDGDRNPIEDALIELWQANAAGRYRHSLDTRDEVAIDKSFSGFGVTASDFSTGGYSFETVKPGPVPDGSGGMQAPHVSLIVQARGMLLPSYTRVYFADDGVHHQRDLVLSGVPPERRSTLIARLNGASRDGMRTYHFDILFQGADETVFFDL
jgi:protocatechuate 3,4-dioxygenase, alpha subunit